MEKTQANYYPHISGLSVIILLCIWPCSIPEYDQGDNYYDCIEEARQHFFMMCTMQEIMFYYMNEIQTFQNEHAYMYECMR